MKKLLSTILIITFLISISIVLGVSEPETKVTVNGEVLDFDVPPTVIKGRTLVPLRGIFEALGVEPVWNGQTRTVSAKKGNKTIILPIGSKKPRVNGEEVEIDVAGTVINGRTLVPARFIAESLDATVGWSGATNTVIIKTQQKDIVLVNDIEVHSIDADQEKANTIEVVDGTLQMEAVIEPNNASDKSVTWSVTSGTGDAIIDQNGVLTAVDDGTVTVVATADDGSGVTDEVEIIINQVKKIVKEGSELNNALNNEDLTTVIFGDDITVAEAIAHKEGQTIEGNDYTLTGDLSIRADNVSVKDLEVDGKTTIEEGYDIKSFTAEGSDFVDLIINDGGSNSIWFRNSRVSRRMTVYKRRVRIMLRRRSRIRRTRIRARNVRLSRGPNSSRGELEGDETDSLVETILREVTFKITDGSDALEGAEININNEELITDSSGEASVQLEGTDENDSPSEYSYTVTAVGYYDETDDVVVEDSNVSESVSMTIKEYTVTFVDYDDSEITAKTVEHGSAATAPEEPTREGYTFTGWDTAIENVTSDLTVTAEYEINTYTVIFEDWDETVLKEETVEHGSAATAPEEPTREGYAFTGWDSAFEDVTDDLTVTAEYEINTYTVIFEDWDETVLKEETVEHGSAATAPEEPTREGYTFNSWDTEFEDVTGDLTVTAQYEESKKDDLGETPPVDIRSWKNPTKPIEIIDDFDRLEWVWSNVDEGVETDSTEVIYEYLGTEEIDGAETDVIYFTAKGDEAKIWIGENGDAAKVNVNGETIPAMIADQALETVLDAVFMPFEQVENLGIYDFLNNEYGDAVWTSVSEEEATFGDHEATVTSIEVTIGPPFREVERGTAIWEIADFGSFQMVSRYSWKDYEEEGTYVSYELKDVSIK